MIPPDSSSMPRAAVAGGSSPPALPAEWAARLRSPDGPLADDENVLAWLEIDLDAKLRFAPGMVVVTSERLLAMSADDRQWQS